MIVLNLLSPHKRERLGKLIRFLFIKEALELVLLTVTILAIAFLFGWMVLTSFLNDLAESTTLVSRDYSSYNQEIVRVNAMIKKVNLASNSYSPLLPSLLSVIQTLPPDIKLNTIDLNRTGKMIIISGEAKTRAALLNYQTILKSAAWLGSFNLPPSQLFQKENVGFEIQAALKN